MILLNFIPSDFEGNYSDPNDCPIARATKRDLKWENPSIDPDVASNMSKNSSFHHFRIKNAKLNNEILIKKGFNWKEFITIKKVIGSEGYMSSSVELHKM